MLKSMYNAIREYMLECMKDSAHDSEHIFRVLYSALAIAEGISEKINYDVLIAACLLHDIGRKEQYADPKICHAEAGGKKAKAFLLKNNWDKEQAEHVNKCISTHRYRGDNNPESIEAKILFDADKLDAAGCLGIVRTLMYKGQVGDPIYTLTGDGICEGISKDDPESFYKEYNFKLKNLYSNFYTSAAKGMALERKEIAEAFFTGLCSQVHDNHSQQDLINRFLQS